MKEKGWSSRVFDISNTTIIVLLAFLCLYPFIYIFSISLSSVAEAARSGFHIYPREINLTAYKMVFSTTEFYRQYMNTIIRTVVGTTFSLLITSMFAYGVASPKMPHRKFLMNFILFTMLFSGGTIPSYINIRNLGLIDNFLVLILPTSIGAYNVIIMRSFFQGIPQGLIESAEIDGANHFRIFFKIVVPMSKPVIATVALWIAVMHWNAWYDAMIYINSESLQVVQNFLRKIIMENSTSLIEKGIVREDAEFTSETIKAATIVVTILPILAAYPFVQKYFVKGVNVGAVKG